MQTESKINFRFCVTPLLNCVNTHLSQENMSTNTFDLSALTKLDAGGALKIALTETRNKSYASRVFLSRKYLKIASIKLAGMVTAFHPGADGGKLLSQTMEKALTVFKRAICILGLESCNFATEMA